MDERLGDESLGNLGTVRVGSIDKIDAQFHRALQDGDRSARSAGSPQIPAPVSRIVPNRAGEQECRRLEMFARFGRPGICGGGF